MPRQPKYSYIDPLDAIWLTVAFRVGFRVLRSDEVYASVRDGVIWIGEPSTLDPDDCLAQMIFHELCHSLIQGPDQLVAEDWGLDADRIGVMGFSAGGHAASTATVHHVDADPDSEDPVLRVSSRPDFSILIYPVISMRDGVTHNGSRTNLLGRDPDEELLALMSTDEQVDADTPPTFLVHSADDREVPIANSERFLAALREHEVPGELLAFQTGGHAYATGRGGHETASWPARCAEWLAERGVIEGADE